jgi:5-methylcytosine-specific restriction protein A
MRSCKYPNCSGFTTKGDYGYCDDHSRLRPEQEKKKYDHHKLYDKRQWRKRRAAYLRVNPQCVECEKHGIIKPADVVDHIIPHGGDPELFWSSDNWQGLCVGCHNSKTNRERGLTT